MTEVLQLDHAGECLILCNIAGKVFYCSNTLKMLLGKDLSGKHFYDYLEEEQVPQILDEVRDGGVCEFYCKVEGQNFFINAQKAEYGLRIDLFPREESTTQFMQLVSGQFFCREIQNYMAAMLPAAQKLAREVPEELQHEAAIVLRNAYCQMRLQRNLCSLITAQNRLTRLYLSREDMGQVVREIANSVQPYCEQVGIQVSCTAPEEPLFCSIDVHKVRRMIFQLVSNSIKSQPNGGRIAFSLREREEEVTITVSDSGTGISPDALQDVFRKYLDQDPSTGDTLGGMGLGLPLSKHIAELHGGHMVVVSNEGEGAAICVVLPKEAKGECAPLGMPAPDYTGGFNLALLELSTVLDSRCYM